MSQRWGKIWIKFVSTVYDRTNMVINNRAAMITCTNLDKIKLVSIALTTVEELLMGDGL